MKKLALTLAALATVSAVASAKEVVAAPVVAVEPAVVCPEPVIAWRPTGNFGVEYTYYGENEYESADFGRIQAQGMVNLTPNQKIDFRTRAYNSYQTVNGSLTSEDLYTVGDHEDATYLRLRYYYAHGNLGDSKVSMTSRVLYQNKQGKGGFIEEYVNGEGDATDSFGFGSREQRLEYMAMFQFKNYFGFMPEWFRVSNFELAPRYRYTWQDQSSSYTNTLGMDLYSTFKMPAGFSTTVNLYPQWVESGVNNTDSTWKLVVEWYLNYGYTLYQDGPLAVDFNFEGGLDPYSTNANKKFNKGFALNDKATNSIYAKPSIDLTYKATNDINLYAGIAGEYRNWEYTSVKDMKKWSWMPQVYTGFTVSF